MICFVGRDLILPFLVIDGTIWLYLISDFVVVVVHFGSCLIILNFVVFLSVLIIFDWMRFDFITFGHDPWSHLVVIYNVSSRLSWFRMLNFDQIWLNFIRFGHL